MQAHQYPPHQLQMSVLSELSVIGHQWADKTVIAVAGLAKIENFCG